MISLALAALAISFQEPASIGAIQIGAESIPLVPQSAASGLSAPFEIGGDLYALDQSGTLGRLADLDPGTWLRRAYPEYERAVAGKEIRPLHLKVLVVTRAEVLAEPRTGIWGTVKGSLDEREIAILKQQLALAIARIQAENGFSIETSIGIEPTPWRTTGKFEKELAVWERRMNTANWEDATGKVRYADELSLVVVPTDLTFQDARVVPYRAGAEEGCYRGLVNGLGAGLSRLARARGYNMLGANSRLPQDVARKVLLPGPASSQEFLENSQRWGTLDASPSTPSGAWLVDGKSVMVAPDAVASLVSAIKASGLGIAQEGWCLNGTYLVNLNSPTTDWQLLNALTVNGKSAVNPTGAGPWLSVDERPILRGRPTATSARYASGSIFFSGISQEGITFGGQTISGPAGISVSDPGAVVTVADAAGVTTQVPVLPVSTSLETVTGGAGSFDIRTTEEAGVLEVVLRAGVPHGEVALTRPFQVLSEGQILTFSMKGQPTLPIELLSGGKVIAVLGPSSPFFTSLTVSASGNDWSTYSVPVPTGAGDLTLRAPSTRTEWGGAFAFERSFFLKDLRIQTGTATNVAEWRAAEPLTDQQILEALSTSDVRRVIPALEQLGDEPKPEVLPHLLRLARNPDWTVSRLALTALSRWKGNEAEVLAAFKYAMEMGPFDHNRLAAFEIALAANMTMTTATASSALTSPEWTVRLTATRILRSIGTPEATIALLVMMQDPDPIVRAEAALGADPTTELASRRLLFASVNDPYESVREVALASLMKSPSDDFRTQAYRSVRDESPRVRRAVLAAMQANPREDQRPWIAQGLADIDPSVRAAAVRALNAQAGAVTVKEVEHLVLDPHPEIRRAMQALARNKNLSFPWD